MGSLLEALQAREAAARTRMQALRAEMDRLAKRLAVEQELLGRLEITRQTVTLPRRKFVWASRLRVW